MVTTKSLGGILKLTLHAPQPGKPNWIVHIRRVQDPFNPSGQMNLTLLRKVAYQPTSGLICAAAICVPHSQRHGFDFHAWAGPLVLSPPPAYAMQATITVWVASPSLRPNSWPGKNKGTELIWSAALFGGAKVYVVRKDETAVPIKFAKTMLSTKLLWSIIRHPSSSVLTVNQDSNGVGVFYDFRAAVFLPYIPQVLSERVAVGLRPFVWAFLWLIVLLSGRWRVNWKQVRLKLNSLFSD
jgi:hypothetical protein